MLWTTRFYHFDNFSLLTTWKEKHGCANMMFLMFKDLSSLLSSSIISSFKLRLTGIGKILLKGLIFKHELLMCLWGDISNYSKVKKKKL